jgi:glycosyltransferase involved in cell wall biosynthesis
MNYVIITPAYNEEKYIGKTIDSVLAQTIRPAMWVIVDDGSTDQTAVVVKRYATLHPCIQYVYRQRRAEHSYYASNVYAIREGIQKIKSFDYEYLAILDADIELPSDYYERIFTIFSKNARLGIASGHCVDRVGDRLKKGLYDSRSLPKNIMVFRWQCYEDIGGFIPLRYSGEDTCACFMARMKGWKTWATTDIVVIHNKPIGTAFNKSKIKIRFQQGIGEYFLATHPLFMLLKSIRRCVKEPPFLIGGLALMAGFIFAHFMGQKRQIPYELVEFIRKEQLSRVLKGNKISADFKVDTSL